MENTLAFRRRQSSLGAELTAHLERLIAAGHFPAGEALPSERRLSETLGVSRTSLREALQELENKRLILRQQGRQSIVTDFHKDAGAVTQGLEGLPASIEHVIEIETLIEPHLARLGAQNATRADILQLEAVLESSHEYLPPEESLKKDIEFHLVLARMCSNPLVLGVSRMVSGRTEDERITSHATEECRRICIEGHRMIYSAIAMRDLDQAEQAMRQHLTVMHSFMRDRGKASTSLGAPHSDCI